MNEVYIDNTHPLPPLQKPYTLLTQLNIYLRHNSPIDAQRVETTNN